MTFRRPGAHKRTSALAALIAVSAISLTACTATAEEPADEATTDAASYGDIDVQLSWILNEEWSGEMIAEDSGYYTDAGFDSVRLIAGPSSGISELVSDSADISLTDALSVGAAVAEQDVPVKILGSTFQKNPFTIVSSTSSPIETPEDMIGKKIGVQAANSAVFEAFLTANDIDIDQVDVVPVEYDPSVLVNGDVDGLIAFVTSQSVTLEASGFPVTDLLFADNGLPFVAHVITTTDDAIENDREMLKAFLVAEIRGWTDAVADPAYGAEIAVEAHGDDLGLDIDLSTASAEAQAELLIVSDETVENGLFTISDELQEQTIESLSRAGMDLDAADLFDTSLLAEVYDENPELIDYSK
jgi:ABC-type nitrate/sulfonate/bicarbonate transport system substrate-binding protein